MPLALNNWVQANKGHKLAKGIFWNGKTRASIVLIMNHLLTNQIRNVTTSKDA